MIFEAVVFHAFLAIAPVFGFRCDGVWQLLKARMPPSATIPVNPWSFLETGSRSVSSWGTGARNDSPF